MVMLPVILFAVLLLLLVTASLMMHDEDDKRQEVLVGVYWVLLTIECLGLWALVVYILWWWL